MSHRIISDRLRRYVRALGKDDDLGRFFRKINSTGEAYLFGGASRDVAFGKRAAVHDLDIVVSGVVEESVLRNYCSSVRKNNFGGFRGLVGKYEIDIWELQKSSAFRLFSASDITVERLLRTVCFSTDGIAVSLKRGHTIRTSAFKNSLVSRRLDFVVPPNKLEPVIAARIARLLLKLKLEMTPSVASYFVPCVETFGVSGIIDAEARWRDHRILNEIAVEQVRAELRHAIAAAFESASSSSLSNRQVTVNAQDGASAELFS